MKRSQHAAGGEKRKRTRYAEKRLSGNMMYGPGCCAHDIDSRKVEAVKRAVQDGRPPNRW